MELSQGELLFSFGVTGILLAFIAMYSLFVTRNLIRMIIGLEIFAKGITLLVAVAGYLTKQMTLAQSLIITIIVVEVVITAIAAGIAIASHKKNGGLDVRFLNNLKG